MAHLGVAVLELQGWVTKVISGQDKETREIDPREKQVSSSCVLAVETKHTVTQALAGVERGWFSDYPQTLSSWRAETLSPPDSWSL